MFWGIGFLIAGDNDRQKCMGRHKIGIYAGPPRSSPGPDIWGAKKTSAATTQHLKNAVLWRAMLDLNIIQITDPSILSKNLLEKNRHTLYI